MNFPRQGLFQYCFLHKFSIYDLIVERTCKLQCGTHDLVNEAWIAFAVSGQCGDGFRTNDIGRATAEVYLVQDVIIYLGRRKPLVIIMGYYSL